MSDQRWWELALCAEIDPELWYPGKGEPVTTAKRMCQRCLVAAPCLEETLRIEALEPGEPKGVRGGLSANERKPLIKARRAETERESPQVSRIRVLAKAGRSYAEMAAELGIKPASVGAICRNHNIPVPAKRSGPPIRRRKRKPVAGGAR